MKIGIFSGSFNPVHLGHLIVANYVAEYTDIEQVWFVVTPHNPLKQEKTLLDENERLKMVELATKPYEKLVASDFEFHLPRPSYTIDTLKALTAKFPEHEFTLIIGGDSWDSFSKWKDYREMLETSKIQIYPRPSSQILIPKHLRRSVKVLESPVIEISSSFIRDAIEDKKNVRPFLSVDVFEYIMKHKLYD